jgi:hypothetical protein
MSATRRKKNAAANRRRQQKQRRGILILIVLSLLFLFVMIAVTFVLIANRQNSTATKAATADQLGDTPLQEVDMAMWVLVRGDNSPLSPFSINNLLVDMYGDPPAGSSATNPNQYSKRINGQYTINANGYATVALASTTNEYDGRVITVIPGSNTGTKSSLVSSRIFASDGTNVYLMPFRDPTGQALTAGSYDFLINGREFAGTGKTGGSIIVNPVSSMTGSTPTDPSAPGGENESYDAPDFNNPHLAYRDPLTGKIKPSFHDPALLKVVGATNSSVLFRPLGFTGGNPSYNAIPPDSGSTATLNPWDVDNDGDGIPDSIWIDPGFPVQVSRDGRLYKRLIAPLIIDLDGRLNLNTAGTTKEIGSLTKNPTNAMPFAVGTSPGDIKLGRGHGFGPAEINIMKAPFTSIGTNLLNNKGRYFTDNYPGPDSTNFLTKKFISTPDDYSASATAPTPYTGSPPDHWGRYMRGIDFSGNVLFANYWQEGTSGETANSPYLLDMSRNVGRGLDTNATPTPQDNLFSASELERFLRGFDSDAGNLPNRLLNICSGQEEFVFHGCTTDSWDTPVLGVLPQASASGNPTKHISELLPTNLRTQALLKTVIPPDMLAGLKFNINWPFGDGKDSNNNYVTDEAGETDANFILHQGIDTNLDGSTNSTDNFFARQQMAKYLYVLMTLIQDPGLTNTPNEQTQQRIAQWAVNVVDYMDADNIMTCFEYDMNIANGWDQNANGFLTSSDLTAGGDLRVVWGVEQPALLLTESFAFHDRRLRDSKYDDGVKKKRDENNKDDSDPKDKKRDDDPDLDQSLIPRGPAFVELYAPHSPLLPVGSGDLYERVPSSTSPGTYSWGLKLDKMTPDKTPVWRIVVTESAKKSPGNDYQTLAQMNQQTFTGQTPQNTNTPGYNQNVLYNGGANIPQPTIERIVVFTKNADIAKSNMKDKNRVYCMADDNPTTSPGTQQNTPDNLTLYGGQYAVLFPHVLENTGKYSMGYSQGTAINYPLGNEVDPVGSKKGIPSKQGVRIDYNSANVFQNGSSGKGVVDFMDTNATAQGTLKAVDYARPVMIPLASYYNATTSEVTDYNGTKWTGSNRVGFSVSEPLFSSGYYPEPKVSNPATNLIESYGQPADDGIAMGEAARDKPLESSTGTMPNAPIVTEGMLATGTYSNFKTLVLQRVADPTRDYDETNNPYITVDWLPIDVTVFNGDDRPPGANADFDEDMDPWDKDDPTANKGAPTNPKIGTRQRGGQLTNYKQGQTVSPTSATNTENSNYHLWTPTSDRSQLNNPAAKNGNAIFAFEVDRAGTNASAQTLGYLNANYGDPLQLPATTPKIYLGCPQHPFPNLSWNNRPYLNPMEVMLVPASQAGRLGMEYNTPSLANEDYAGTNVAPNTPFGHLLNFFASSNGTHYHLILDWITTGSPFKGTETWFDQTKSANFNSIQGLNKFQYPFNSVHGYREPGKPNINTISDPRVWDALMGDWGASGAGYGCTFAELVQSRRGSTTGTNQLDANGSFPTAWGNPFRVASAAKLIPTSATPPSPEGETNNVGMLRKHPTKTTQPLFGADDYNIGQQQGNDYRDPARNRLLAVENIERLSNLVTTRSNVYAIWVTVGYFEVTPSTSNPDGYQIGQELGTDTGEIKRHRGFGVYDRSIPVGYERGMNHNVEKGFLIKKMLE